MMFAPRRVVGTSVLLLALVGCGPRAAVSGTNASSPTPDCSPRGGSVTTVVTRVVAVGTAIGVVSQIAPGGAETPTTLPRAQLVAEAVATATAVARIPTPTPQPTSTPTPQPAGTPTPQPACATLVSGSATAVAPPPKTQPAAAPTAGPNPPAVPPTTSPPAVPPTTSPPPGPQGNRGAPAPAPSPGAGTLVSPSVLLASDAGAVVELHVGERFVLLLGQYTGTDWQVQLSDPSVLQRVGGDGQGVYQAAAPGETQLTAIGDPACRRAQPPCAAPSRLVQFVVRVQ